MPKLIHFKCETCVSVDPKQVATELFGTNKHLVVLHKGKNENPHWHFQGELAVSEQHYDLVRKQMADKHSKKIAAPKSRPVKAVKGEVTELGYQYMLKESPPVVVTSSGFTQEIIDELHEASVAHVDSLKQNLMTVFQDLEFMTMAKARKLNPKVTSTEVCKCTHNRARKLAAEYYLKEDKIPPPNIQKLILWYLMKTAVHRNIEPELYKSYWMKLM